MGKSLHAFLCCAAVLALGGCSFLHDDKLVAVAAGKKLRRWVWLKTPTPEDADLLQMYKSIKAEDFNFDAWESFLERLEKEGYIKMEELS